MLALRFRQTPPLPDAGAGLEDVEILEDVRDSHQAESSQEPQTNPVPETQNIIGRPFSLEICHLFR